MIVSWMLLRSSGVFWDVMMEVWVIIDQNLPFGILRVLIDVADLRRWFGVGPVASVFG